MQYCRHLGMMKPINREIPIIRYAQLLKGGDDDGDFPHQRYTSFKYRGNMLNLHSFLLCEKRNSHSLTPVHAHIAAPDAMMP